jgi:hypothetical protein
MLECATSVSPTAFKDSDKELLHKLRVKHRPDMQSLLMIKSRISTANKAWMESFIAANGIAAVIEGMSYRIMQSPLAELDVAILYELLCCAKVIMNTSFSMDCFVATKGAIRAVVYSLLFEWKTLALEVMEVIQQARHSSIKFN